MDRFIPRAAEARFRKLLKTFPAVMVAGPRQCGKTTLVRKLLPAWRHLDLERKGDGSMLEADVSGFLDRHPRAVTFDEAQRVEDLFPALRHAIDAGRGQGRYVLLGSATPMLRREVSESLAGRIGHLDLTPFLPSELVGRPQSADRWFWGGLPPVHARRGDGARADWLDAYLSDVLDKDLRVSGHVLPVARLRRLFEMLTHVHGNLLNLSDLARSLGVSYHTIADYLDVFEGAFLIRRLQPYHANVSKRLTKSPKIYIRDTGLLHLAAGLRHARELDGWPRRGASFEGMVIEELATRTALRHIRPGIHFWRTQAGGEVDLLIQVGTKLLPIEIKTGRSVNRHDVVALRQCMADLGHKHGWVITGEGARGGLGKDIEIVPWNDVIHGKDGIIP
jgi:hypothetical protein